MSDITFVTYRDEAHGSEATVMKYDGFSWVVVGKKVFSPDTAESFQNPESLPYRSLRNNAVNLKNKSALRVLIIAIFMWPKIVMFSMEKGI